MTSKTVSWEDIELGDLTLPAPDRGRTLERQSSLVEVTVGGSLAEDQSEIRQRRSPGRNDSQIGAKTDSRYLAFLQLLESDIKTHYSSTNLRNVDQLYYKLIPDTILQKDSKNNEIFHTQVYWIKTEHLYWKVLDVTYGDRCVVAKIPTGNQTALLAIGKEYMDEIVDQLWKLLYSNNLTLRPLVLDD